MASFWYSVGKEVRILDNVLITIYRKTDEFLSSLLANIVLRIGQFTCQAGKVFFQSFKNKI